MSKFHAVMYNEKTGNRVGQSLFEMTKEYFNDVYISKMFKGAKKIDDSKYSHPFLPDVVIICEAIESIKEGW